MKLWAVYCASVVPGPYASLCAYVRTTSQLIRLQNSFCISINIQWNINKLLILHGYSSCPAFLQFDWLIIGQDSAILRARWIQLLNKTEKARWPELSQNSRKTSESCKTWKNTFDETRERLFFGKFSVSFRTIFGDQQKTLGKWFWTNFVKNNLVLGPVLNNRQYR